jgi:6-phosphogluconolactonase
MNIPDIKIKVSQSQSELARELAAELSDYINTSAGKGKKVTIALSGGSTPAKLFSCLADFHNESTQWQAVHFFWGDERCVAPDDPESNFGTVKKILLNKIRIPSGNIHRMRGEDDPHSEAARYASEITLHTRKFKMFPRFDLLILGLGEDGHTASIFPGNERLFSSDRICEVSRHPVSAQNRITITGPVINSAERILFLVTGSSKAEIVAEIIENQGISDYPAALVQPFSGSIEWYLDIDAASMLSQWA